VRLQVFQEVELGEEFEQPRVTNVVDFGSGIGVLRVRAVYCSNRI
jgi:16S rRNA G1207 methylase RsmC